MDESLNHSQPVCTETLIYSGTKHVAVFISKWSNYLLKQFNDGIIKLLTHKN